MILDGGSRCLFLVIYLHLSISVFSTLTKSLWSLKFVTLLLVGGGGEDLSSWGKVCLDGWSKLMSVISHDLIVIGWSTRHYQQIFSLLRWSGNETLNRGLSLPGGERWGIIFVIQCFTFSLALVVELFGWLLICSYDSRWTWREKYRFSATNQDPGKRQWG